jgi:biotin carboxylase
VVSELGEAQRFALQHGYPVVVKRNHSSAGQGVAICADAAALSAAFETLGQSDGLALGDARDGELLVQAHIPGRIHYHNSVAWQGVLLAGQASEQLAATARGPASAVRYYHSPVLRAMSATLAAGFGISGVYVPEFVIHEDTGDAYLLEINRRMTHGTHRGAAFGVDLGAALFAAINGLPSPTRPDLDPGEEHFAVHFPLEWTRDPASRYLREYPVDVPWDEPELVEAIVAQVMANFRSA